MGFGNVYEHWIKAIFIWYQFKNAIADVMVRDVLPSKLPKLFGIANYLFEGLLCWGIGIYGESQGFWNLKHFPNLETLHYCQSILQQLKDV